MPLWSITLPAWLQRHLPDGWTGADLFWAMLAFIVVSFVGSILMVGWVVIHIPEDYFVSGKPPRAWSEQHPLVRWPLLVLKNILGLILVGLGILMSLPGVPGQGLLTVFIGMMLVNFPGKRHCEKWCLTRRGVLGVINRTRVKYGRLPLRLEEKPTDSQSILNARPPDDQASLTG